MLAEFGRHPLAPRRILPAGPQPRHTPHLGHPYQLALGPPFLEVKSTQHTRGGAGEIVLNKRAGKPGECTKAPAWKVSQKKSPVVCMYVRLQQKHSPDTRG